MRRAGAAFALACVLALTPACSPGDAPPVGPPDSPGKAGDALKPALAGLVVTDEQALATVP